MRSALVFGGSGQIGRPLVQRLCDDGWEVTGISRDVSGNMPPARDTLAAMRWLRGGFDDMPKLPPQFDAIVSCGPLDRFGTWYSQSRVSAGRVVAFGSTSLVTKRVSSDPTERALVDRLQRGEHQVFKAATLDGAAATLLRPTLVYGVGRDASLTRIASMAAKWGVLPLPSNATGLRQPVHVDDLADAAVACLLRPEAAGQAYALPGGETLAYREMVSRVLATLTPPVRLLQLPPLAFDALLGVARLAGRAQGMGDTVPRMRRDLVFDSGPAQRDFGYAPRPFQPIAGMFQAAAPSQ